jgi:hypothetical protein
LFLLLCSFCSFSEAINLFSSSSSSESVSQVIHLEILIYSFYPLTQCMLNLPSSMLMYWCKTIVTCIKSSNLIIVILRSRFGGLRITSTHLTTSIFWWLSLLYEFYNNLWISEYDVISIFLRSEINSVYLIHKHKDRYNNMRTKYQITLNLLIKGKKKLFLRRK